MKRSIVLESLIRLRQLLPKSFKVRALWTVLLLVLSAILELVSLGALIPFFIAIVKEDAFDTGWLAEIYQFSGLETESIFIIVLGLIVFSIVLIKNVLVLAIAKYQANFSFGLYSYFAQALQRHYYSKGFSYMSNRNSNEIYRDIVMVSVSFAQALVIPLLNLLTEVVIIVLVGIGIVLYDPRAVFLVLLLVPIFAVFYRIVRKKIAAMAEEVNELQAETAKSIYQSIFGFVDVIMNNNEQWFFREFRKNVERLKELRSWQHVYNLMPSKVIESGVVLAVLLIMIYGFTFLENRSELVMLLGVFGVAAYRTIPSINRMMMALMSVRSFNYTLKIMEQVDYEEDDTISSAVESMNFNEAIEIQNLSFRYSESELPVLRTVCLTIRKGECIGVVGKSGSGKTTLMNLMLGFLVPSEGVIRIDDKEISSGNIRSWRETAGYVRQEVFLVDGTLAENIALGFAEVDSDRVLEVAKKASLTELIEKLPQGIDTPVGERGAMISGGQRQRVGIARALYSGAKVLFFDEATSALDSETEEEITEAIHHLSDEKVTIVIVAHRHSTLKYCDRIYELEEGRVKAIHEGYEALGK